MNKYLIKLANHLDKKGLHKEADYVDWIIKTANDEDMLILEPTVLGKFYTPKELISVFKYPKETEEGKIVQRSFKGGTSEDAIKFLDKLSKFSGDDYVEISKEYLKDKNLTPSQKKKQIDIISQFLVQLSEAKKIYVAKAKK